MNRADAREEALRLAIEERNRQIAVEGFTEADDDEATAGNLALAGALYMMPDSERDYEILVDADGDIDGSGAVMVRSERASAPKQWPWAAGWWKPTADDRLRELSKAVALGIAEMERLLRARP